MLCSRCGGKGYTEGWYHYSGKYRPNVAQCCDLTAYSKRIQELFGEDALDREIAHAKKDYQRLEENLRRGAPCEVIPFPKR